MNDIWVHQDDLNVKPNFDKILNDVVQFQKNFNKAGDVWYSDDIKSDENKL
jgi:hypothetical protein